MHDPMLAIEYMLDMPRSGFDVLQIERLEREWRSIFFMDDSGRSTGKSHNLLAGEIAKLPLIQNRTGILLGLDKKIGNQLFDEHIVEWIRGTGHLKDFYDVRRSDMEGRVAKKDYGAMAEFLPACVLPGMPSTTSQIKTMTPDQGKEGKSLQSWRFNFVHFSEWTSWPKPEIMGETIEPIATRTNYLYKRTQDLMRRSEQHLQRPLGTIDNETWARAFGLVEGRHPRPHIGSDEELDTTMAIHNFKNNFFVTYGFSYDDGIGYDNINFPPLQTKDDIVRFFENFGRGDEGYSNQIVYDGSAKRPSDDCYIFRKFFSDMIEDGHPAYKDFNCSVEDIDPSFDGIIFDSAIIKKFKESNLEEDYLRVYGGKWTEGYKNKPYDPAAITKSMRDYMPSMSADANEMYVVGVDAAKGTERMRSKGKATKGTGHGDDAGAAVVRLGDGTSNKPHRVSFVYVAEDVRKDPMAFDLHKINGVFNPLVMALDPGGGGGDLTDSLGKPRLIDEAGIIHDVVPIVLHDNEIAPDTALRKIHYFSRSDPYITGLYAQSAGDKAAWAGDDALVNKLHEVVGNMFEQGLVEVPRKLTAFEIAEMQNNGSLTSKEKEAILATQRAIDQINAIRYAMDPRTGARKKTSRGLFQFESPRRKDLAYCVIYALFFANLIMEYRKVDGSDDDIPMSRG